MPEIQIVPAILRKTFEQVQADWKLVQEAAGHIQLDITDGVFAGDGTFREIPRFKQLPESQKIELHMMVQTPAYFVDDIIDLQPARCAFHVESFAEGGDARAVFEKMRSRTQTELALAINPDTPAERLDEFVDVLDYVLFLGVNPGQANQSFEPTVYPRIGTFAGRYPEMSVAVDGHVTKETAGPYVQAGARILCANTSVFGQGNPVENMQQLKLLAEAALS